jgi:hypothetical protein
MYVLQDVPKTQPLRLEVGKLAYYLGLKDFPTVSVTVLVSKYIQQLDLPGECRNTCTHTHAQTYTDTHIHTYTQTLMHTCIHTNAYIHTLSHTHTLYVCMYVCNAPG